MMRVVKMDTDQRIVIVIATEAGMLSLYRHDGTVGSAQIDRLRELLDAVPFIPFIVRFQNGRRLAVNVVDRCVDYIACDDDGRDPRIWLDGRRYSPADIVAIEAAGGGKDGCAVGAD